MDRDKLREAAIKKTFYQAVGWAKANPDATSDFLYERFINSQGYKTHIKSIALTQSEHREWGQYTDLERRWNENILQPVKKERDELKQDCEAFEKRIETYQQEVERLEEIDRLKTEEIAVLKSTIKNYERVVEIDNTLMESLKQQPDSVELLEFGHYILSYIDRIDELPKTDSELLALYKSQTDKDE